MLEEVSTWGYRNPALFWSWEFHESGVWENTLEHRNLQEEVSGSEVLRGLYVLTSPTHHLLLLNIIPWAPITPPNFGLLEPCIFSQASTSVPMLFPLPGMSFSISKVTGQMLHLP